MSETYPTEGPRDGSDEQRPWGDREAFLGLTRAQAIVLAVVAAAVIASVALLLWGTDLALKIGLVVALWAVVVPFFLVDRYRRRAADADDELEYLEQSHREEIARLEQRQSPAATGGSGEVSLRAEDRDMLREIRQSLAELRGQLEELRGREFEYEPTALTAHARRLRELDARAGQAAARQPAEHVGRVAGAPTTDAVSGRLSSSGEETEQALSPEVARAIRGEPAPRRGQHRAPDEAVGRAQRDTSKRDAERPASGRRTAEDQPARRRREEAPAPRPAAEQPRREPAGGAPTEQFSTVASRRGQHRAPDESGADESAARRSRREEPRRDAEEHPSGGRRRADERSQSLSVADLMKNAGRRR